MSILRAPMLAAALAALAAAFSAAPSAFAATYSFETEAWKIEWNDFHFGVSAAQDDGVTFTWGTMNGVDGYGNTTAYGMGLPHWGAVSASGRNGSDVSDTGTTFSLLAKPGYLLTDLGVRAAGFYGSLGPSASVDPSVTMTVTAYGSLHPVIAIAALNLELGTWNVDTGVALPGAVPTGPLSFDVRQSVSTNSFWDGATSSGDRNGISLYWSVAAVPEPHEWLLMLSGLGMVGMIAQQRRRRECVAV